MRARRDYLKTLLVSDSGKDYIDQMVANTKCVLARYQKNASIFSRDEAGNVGVEEFVDSYEIVYEFAQKNNIPIVTSMGGGYSEKIYDIVEAHCNTYKCMLQLTD